MEKWTVLIFKGLFVDRSEVFFVSWLLGDVWSSVTFHFHTQIVQQLFAMKTGIRGLGLSQVEHPLELSVVGVVLFIAIGGQVEVVTSLICFKKISTVFSKEFASGWFLSPPSGNKAKSQDSSKIFSGPFNGSSKSVELFHFEWVVFFELLEGDFVGVGDWARVSDKFREGILFCHHNIITHQLGIKKESINYDSYWRIKISGSTESTGTFFVCTA